MKSNPVPRDVAGTRFERVRVKAFWNAVLAFLAGRDNHLVSWSQAQDELRFQGESGTQLKNVPVKQIIGTVGRYEDFDRAFLPTHEGLSVRWQSIRHAHEDGTTLPKVQLYQIGDAYFVVDGHHRVSVARDGGVLYLEAWVTEVKTRVPVSGHLDANKLTIRGEYTRFLEQTRLDDLRPEQCIEFTVRGSYDRLLQHIKLHAPDTDASSPSDPSEQAVCDWYDHTYLPLIKTVREHDILADFPARTEADLYVWLVDNQAELQSSCGLAVDPERAAEHFAERHGRHLLTRAAAALHDWLSQDACELVTSGDAKT